MASPAAAAAVDGVSTQWPVEVVGPSSAQGGSGAVLVQPSGTLEGSRLQAEEVVIEFAWQRGAHVRGDRSVVNHAMDRGRDSITLRDVTIGFLPFAADPLFLAFSEGGPMEIGVESPTGFTLVPSEGEQVVSVGTTSNNVSAGEDPANLGFSYRSEGPTVKGETQGSLLVQGSFTLFAHDLRIEAEGKERDWSEWTGYWEGEPGASVTEYELRVTLLHVRNGTFSTPGDQISLFMPTMDIHVDGSIKTNHVTGRIRQGGVVHVFERDRFRLDGTGRLGLEAAPAGSDARLWLRPSDRFELTGASAIETVPSAAEGTPVAAATGAASIVLLVLLGVVGLMAVGMVPAPTAGVRQHQYEAWMRKGDSAGDEKAWRRASTYYRRAARIRKDDPSALFEWARAELEGGDPKKAERLALRLAALPDMDQADALELLVWTAHLRGDHEALEERLGELAEAAPEVAAQVSADLGLDDGSLGARRPNSPGYGEGLDGYA